jgi:hypothetical protein
MLEALRRQQEEDARRNRKKFLRKGEGKQAIDERLRVDTEKVFGFGSVLPSSLYLHVPPTCFLCLFQALMQKRVRNYESCGVFTSGNTTVAEDDHWLLRDLAQKVAITEGNTSEDSPVPAVDLKGAILNPDKGALELVQSTGCFTASSWVLNGFVIAKSWLIAVTLCLLCGAIEHLSRSWKNWTTTSTSSCHTPRLGLRRITVKRDRETQNGCCTLTFQVAKVNPTRICDFSE